jgi:hypothetical protein
VLASAALGPWNAVHEARPSDARPLLFRQLDRLLEGGANPMNRVFAPETPPTFLACGRLRPGCRGWVSRSRDLVVRVVTRGGHQGLSDSDGRDERPAHRKRHGDARELIPVWRALPLPQFRTDFATTIRIGGPASS